MKLKDQPAYGRPREKMHRLGREALSTAELLAILIDTGTTEKTAVGLAEELLALREDGLLYLADCAPEELARVRGIGSAKAARILAAVELGRRIATMPRKYDAAVTNAGQAARLFMERLRYYRKEVFCILMLDTKGGVVGIEDIAVGDISSSIVNPRETFCEPVKRGVYSVILVHNHPSGDPTPSREDLETTARLVEAGEILGIQVLDHLIIGDGIFFSMAEKGIL